MLDIPYGKLKEKPLHYEIMILRDHAFASFTAIADYLGISSALVSRKYYYIKRQQIECYVNHLAIAHGHEDAQYFKEMMKEALNCYKNYSCVAAYFESNYQDILTAYRAGEPGLPNKTLEQLLPLITEISQETVKHIVFMRDKLTFAQIGDILYLTPEKVKDLYGHYYHQKFLNLVESIMKATGKNNLKKDYYNRSSTPKKRYELLLQNYPDFSDENE